jgi:hypothetical protein
MLKGITWSNYFTVTAIAIGFWYLVVGLIYYRKEIGNLIKGKYKMPLKRKIEVVEEEDEIVVVTTEDEDEPGFTELEGIVTDIRHSILEEAGNKVSKEALLNQLKARLNNYGGLRQPAFRFALNNFIVQHAESICGVVYSEEELDAAWDTLPR